MKHIKKYMVVAALIILPNIVLAEKVFISDIIDNPSKYYNLKVTLRGRVVDVKVPTSPTARGYYILMDNSDKTIKIIANTLPAPEKDYTVVGVVQVDPQTQTPFIREISRTPVTGVTTPTPAPQQAAAPQAASGFSTLIIILVILIVIVVALILILIFRKGESTKATFAPPPPPQVTPPTTPQTQQVNVETVSTSYERGKTTQVPSVLAEIIFENGPLAGKHIPLKHETIIGRESGDIIVPDSSVSREHAKIVFIGGKYFIENLSTTNPTIVNGKRIQELTELKDGDEIICGLIKMKFKIL